MKMEKFLAVPFFALCFLNVAAAAASRQELVPHAFGRPKELAPRPQAAPQDIPGWGGSLEQIHSALKSAGLMSPDFKPAMVPVGGGTLPEGSELAGTVVAPFLIGKYEVTFGEWLEVQAWAGQPKNGYDLGGAGRHSAPQNPVVGANWFDALKWCNAKSEMEGLAPVYRVAGETYKTGETIPSVDASANGYRLPTDAEWEWAARGGPASRGFTYSGSNQANEAAWYFGSFAGEGTKAAGTKLGNELGIHDMSGNAFEWCWDARGTQPRQRSIRGGCWAYHADECAVHDRARGMDPGVRVVLVGFRTARNAAE